MATPKGKILQIFEKVDILTPTLEGPLRPAPPWGDIFLKVWTLDLGGIAIPAWGKPSYMCFGLHFHEVDSTKKDLC